MLQERNVPEKPLPVAFPLPQRVLIGFGLQTHPSKVVPQNFLLFHVVKLWIIAPIRHFHTDRKPDEPSSENFQILFIFIIPLAKRFPLADIRQSRKFMNTQESLQSFVIRTAKVPVEWIKRVRQINATWRRLSRKTVIVWRAYFWNKFDTFWVLTWALVGEFSPPTQNRHRRFFFTPSLVVSLEML